MQLARRRTVSLIALLAAVAFTPLQEADTLLIGFTAEGSARQLELERQVDAEIDADNLRDWMEYIVSKPIYVGAPHNLETAEWMVEQFRSWGYEADLAEYQVLFPTPRIRQLEMLSPTRYVAQLREPVLEADRTSAIEQDRLPTYNAYSADGDVTGELVYVNYGIPADYDSSSVAGSTCGARS